MISKLSTKCQIKHSFLSQESSSDDENAHRRRKKRKVNSHDDGYISPDEPTVYLNGNPNVPILREGKANWTNQQLADLMLNGKSKRICSQRPLAPQKNFSFLIDSGKLGDRDDWKSDDLSSWRNCGSSGRVFTIKGGKVVQNSKLPQVVANRPNLRNDQYVFKITYYRHKKYADFKRNSVVTCDSNGEQQDLMITEYFFTGQEHPVSPDKHGNAINDRKFIPTAASTKKHIVSALSSTVRGPHTIFDKVSEEVGGLGTAYAASDMPRGVKQISYARKHMRQKGGKDQISELLDNVQSSPEYVHGLQLGPSIRFVVATPQTLANMAVFCTNYAECTPLCIDTTYGIGEFFVTTTSYKNLKVAGYTFFQEELIIFERNFFSSKGSPVYKLPYPNILFRCNVSFWCKK